jgi:N-acetyl-gamma-glutamyl-phosphate reductase
MHNYAPRTAAVLGASGYTGIELVSILLGHPAIRLERVFANTSAEERVAGVFPRLTTDLSFERFDADSFDPPDVTFLALPSGEAQRIVPAILGRTVVIDLSGDFRLADVAEYARWYGREHTAADLVGAATYGIPELFGDAIADSRFIANPGCYATAVILALAPLAERGLLPASITVTATSGVSGAGRSPSLRTHFAEAGENVGAYRVGTHQHTPEIEWALAMLGGSAPTILFVPHLVPIVRGITAAVSIPIDASAGRDAARLYRERYAECPFVRVSADRPPEVSHVARTNFCDLLVQFDGRSGQLLILAALDNLVKGAAGQAVQNMNLALGYPETLGLHPGRIPENTTEIHAS